MSDLLERLKDALFRLADGAVLAGGRRLQAGDARAEFGYVVRAGLQDAGPRAWAQLPPGADAEADWEVQDEGSSLRVLVCSRGECRGQSRGEGDGFVVRVEGGGEGGREGGDLVVERGAARPLRVPLPVAVRPETLRWSARCGVLEVTVEKGVEAAPGGESGGAEGE